MDSEPGGRWISYTELAEIRGTDKTSALKLALRKKWQRRKDNHGTMHVCVPAEWLGHGVTVDHPVTTCHMTCHRPCLMAWTFHAQSAR